MDACPHLGGLLAGSVGVSVRATFADGHSATLTKVSQSPPVVRIEPLLTPGQINSIGAWSSALPAHRSTTFGERDSSAMSQALFAAAAPATRPSDLLSLAEFRHLLKLIVSPASEQTPWLPPRLIHALNDSETSKHMEGAFHQILGAHGVQHSDGSWQLDAAGFSELVTAIQAQLLAQIPSAMVRQSESLYRRQEVPPVAMDASKRIAELLRTSQSHVASSDWQLARYASEGDFYDAHYDAASNFTGRWATMMVYLNDIQHGGETWFPSPTNGTLGEQMAAAQALQLKHGGCPMDDGTLISPRAGVGLMRPRSLPYKLLRRIRRIAADKTSIESNCASNSSTKFSNTSGNSA
ncbi:hypothetical protein EMIHUDRAFT_218501 [Emiliania huxleyi CCMP1516]|uniref:Prolyl 4-hydroxylase alpha subunit domain-containing protein n=2 Tax=Emiliania huxleyi TaxID=2903 RepID=A0A0D3I8E3_EMIH1|nr:hypothetical protein EMIHUDRAFT_218501 [Emiliania huxleyi CCMP1516]EOD07528.1 hypothetical protein EMIHUDRAFT_218501 [Emiliania huxleyi CCMP1516]|eukprot:XP_005759957.1 hypothetical protein EMIHUDRAFT_218501 [Emiliania huxleyi CCMP1516]